MDNKCRGFRLLFILLAYSTAQNPNQYSKTVSQNAPSNVLTDPLKLDGLKLLDLYNLKQAASNTISWNVPPKLCVSGVDILPNGIPFDKQIEQFCTNI